MTTNAPQKLGRYEIIEEIGKGAMGVVYLARDPLIGRQVALKTFRVGFSAKDQELAQFRSRFVREAQSAGILSHPNIVTIHDVVDEGGEGTCFIAMEFVKGTNLKQLMQRPETFSHDRLIDILSQIAEGLDYAHSRGVVHRDIKPANILIAQDGKVKITDFGIARLDTSNLTMEGQLLGTPNYMAPEQIQGKEVDHRADIFSLGVVFYEMLTRRKPFQGENLTAVTHKIVYEPFTPAEEIIKDLPPGLTAIMTRCLEKDPNRRYPRAAEIAAELRRGGARQVEVVAEAVAESAADDNDDTSATQEVPPLAEETIERTEVRTREPESLLAAATAKLPRIQPPPAAPAPIVPSTSPAPTAAPGPSTPPPPPTVPAGGGPVPAVAVPAGSISGSTKISAAPQRIRSQRLVQYGLLGLAGLTVVALIVLWASGRTESPAPPPAGPTVEVQRQLDLAAALAGARQRLDSGDLQGALAALAQAQQIEPENSAARELRAEIERVSLDLASAAEREQRVSEGLILAREEYSKRRYEAAIAAANGVLALVADHPEAAKLAADSETALARQKERERSQRSAEAAQAAAANVPAPAPVPQKPVVAPSPAPVAGDANVEIDFYSEVSEGVLTVYSGERQIFREPFKFVKKTGFLSKERIPGALSAQRTLPAGAVALRVYVTLPGKPTKAIVVEDNLVGGSNRRLIVRVDADARVDAQLE
ncbi:MAG: serine/threonine protein kinase [Thermoanaerobaculia bacterium]|nr:serine/threonine protein kinase [Thermoanaerobaculia bacterium]